MNTKKLFQFTKASQLLPAAGINYNTVAKNKMRGLDSNGKPTDFTEDEKKKIEQAFWKLTNLAGMSVGKALVAMRKPKGKIPTKKTK